MAFQPFYVIINVLALYIDIPYIFLSKILKKLDFLLFY
jgi:hypothetical protein